MKIREEFQLVCRLNRRKSFKKHPKSHADWTLQFSRLSVFCISHVMYGRANGVQADITETTQLAM